MSMRSVVKWVLLTEAFAVATYGLGWWSVPIVAALYSAFSGDRMRGRSAAACAAAGWGSLLLLDVARGQVGMMGTQLAGVISVPAFAVYLLTLLFPALLAWCAATIAPDFRRGTKLAAATSSPAS